MWEGLREEIRGKKYLQGMRTKKEARGRILGPPEYHSEITE
jgi:hypothetical protein